MRGGRAVVAALMLSACQGASSSPGLNAVLRVQGAQVIAGRITDAPQGQVTATVSGLTTNSNLIFPGLQGRAVAGKVGPGASGVAIGLAGDEVFWALPAGAHDSVTPELLLFTAQVDFSPELAGSSAIQRDAEGRSIVPVVFRAVTPDGKMGAPLALGMRLIDAESSGSLVVALEWSGAVDLDLRVVAPALDGAGSVEIWSKHGSNLPADVSSGSAGSRSGVGTLDMDSNAACDLDGRNRENVIWQGVPPTGHYVVRVDAFSMCGQSVAEWKVRATYEGQLLTKADGNPAEVFGVATEAATRGEHGAGAGRMALDFDLQFQAR